MATLGLSKVFILDKYFTELQKYWETEKKLQGKLHYTCIHVLCILHRMEIVIESELFPFL